MKKGILILLIGVGFWCFQQSNVTLASELTDDYFDIATNYFNSNNYTKALEYLDDVLKIEPSNFQAQVLKNKILPLCKTTVVAESENSTKVLSTTQNSENFVILDIPESNIAKTEYNSDYFNTKGQEFYTKKDYNSAIDYFNKSLKLDPKNAQAYNNIGMAYWLTNNSNAAIRYFKRANFVNRNYTQPLVNLSLLYKQLGDTEKQVTALQKAIKLNPNDYWAYYLLGDINKSNCQYIKAMENYKQAIEINPKFSQAYLGLALCYFETEEFNYALILLNQYTELNTTSDFAYFMTARTNLILLQYDSAKINIEKAIAINDTKPYQFERAKIEYYSENYQQALDIFQNLLTVNDSAELFNYAGLCNYKLKNIDAAIANFNKAIEIDGLRPIYYYNLAQCYKSLGDKKNYAKYVTTATKITPINYQDFIDLSYIYYDNSNPNYAINTLNDAISRYPNMKALYLSKLKIFESLDDRLHYNEVRNLINERFNTK